MVQEAITDPSSQPTADPLPFPSPACQDVLTAVLRDGAQRMLSQAIEAEVTDWIESHRHLTNEQGHRQVVRNGHLPGRTITTGLGPVEVTQPRVHDRRPCHERQRFSSTILPPSLRKTKSIEELIPWLYLKGISTGDFTDALGSLLGPRAAGLSATTVTRLKAAWEQQYKHWSRQSLADKQYVYVWADGVYFNVRLEDPNNARQNILVLMGATAQGKKELSAISDGYRESEQSWSELLLDVQARGLSTSGVDPKLAVGDGALGFWAALAKVFPATRVQRCWAQDRQRAQQDAQGRASQSQGHAPRYLDGRHEGKCLQSIRSLHRDIPSEVPQSHRVFGEG